MKTHKQFLTIMMSLQSVCVCVSHSLNVVVQRALTVVTLIRSTVSVIRLVRVASSGGGAVVKVLHHYDQFSLRGPTLVLLGEGEETKQMILF